jgi:tetratricopeptide (TPR) repeat protein
MPLRKPILLGLTLFLLVLGIHPASADIGPPSNPPGQNIEPGSTMPTDVRMIDERVVIDIHLPDEPSESEWGDYARVTATFLMRNLGSQAEHMDVRFPLEDESVLMSGSPIQNFQASVNGQSAEIIYAAEPFPHPSYKDIMFNWAKFPVDFPPSKTVTIEVTYLLLPSFGGADAQVYNYILVTGKDWQGTIGRAEIVANFPYAVNAENVFYRPEGSRVSGRQITWLKSDFEPGEADNFWINIMPPSKWLRLAEARAAVKSRPSDAKAWNALGNAYLSLVQNINQEVFQEIFKPEKNDWYVEQGFLAYRKAAELAPDSRRPHIGVAYLLLAKYLPQIPAEQVKAIQAELIAVESLPEAADPETAKADAGLLESVSQSLAYHARRFLEVDSTTPSKTTEPRSTVTATPSSTFNHVPPTEALPAPALQVFENPTATMPATVISSLTAERSQPGWSIPGLLGVGVLLLMVLGLLVRVLARRQHTK